MEGIETRRLFVDKTVESVSRCPDMEGIETHDADSLI